MDENDRTTFDQARSFCRPLHWKAYLAQPKTEEQFFKAVYGRCAGPQTHASADATVLLLD